MSLIQNSILVIGMCILFKVFLFYSDIKENPDKDIYEPLYKVKTYEVVFKSEIPSNDSIYHVVTVVDENYKESEKIVTEDVYDSLSKGSVFKERVLAHNIDGLYWCVNLIVFIFTFSLFFGFSTSKSFVLFSLKDFEIT